PVPTAMTFTSIPVCCLNIGTRASRRPVSWVLVVVARIMDPPILVGSAVGDVAAAAVVAEPAEVAAAAVGVEVLSSPLQAARSGKRRRAARAKPNVSARFVMSGAAYRLTIADVTRAANAGAGCLRM